MQPQVGVGLFVCRDNKVLLHFRKGGHAPKCWSCPGGHLDMYERFEDCALRELAEEAGPDIKVTTPTLLYVANTRFISENKHYVVLLYRCDWISGEPIVMEPEKNDCWAWFQWNKDTLPGPLIQGCQQCLDNNINPFGNTYHSSPPSPLLGGLIKTTETQTL